MINDPDLASNSQIGGLFDGAELFVDSVARGPKFNRELILFAECQGMV